MDDEAKQALQEIRDQLARLQSDYRVLADAARSPEHRKRRGPVAWLSSRTWRLWVATALLLPALYVGSFGPVCRCVTQPDISVLSRLEWFYSPLFHMEHFASSSDVIWPYHALRCTEATRQSPRCGGGSSTGPDFSEPCESS